MPQCSKGSNLTLNCGRDNDTAVITESAAERIRSIGRQSVSHQACRGRLAEKLRGTVLAHRPPRTFIRGGASAPHPGRKNNVSRNRRYFFFFFAAFFAFFGAAFLAGFFAASLAVLRVILFFIA